MKSVIFKNYKKSLKFKESEVPNRKKSKKVSQKIKRLNKKWIEVIKMIGLGVEIAKKDWKTAQREKIVKLEIKKSYC